MNKIDYVKSFINKDGINVTVKILNNKKIKEPLGRHATRTATIRDEDGYWQLKGGEWNEIGTLLRRKQV